MAPNILSTCREGDTVRFLNGLGVDITYAAVNIDGVFYAGTDISEGEKTQLKLSQKHKGPFDLEKYMEDDFDERQKDKILRFMEKCMTAQMQGRNFDPLPGYFIAVAEDNPFIRPDLSGYGLHAGFHIIYGRY